MSKKHFRRPWLVIARISLTLMVAISMVEANTEDDVSIVERNPEDVVVKFYTADLEGARLGLEPGTYKARIAPLVMWQDEPGWDQCIVVEKAYVSRIEPLKGNMAIVEVRYLNIGTLSGGFGWDAEFTENRLTEVVTFIVVREEHGWRIREPIIPPHVYRKVVTKQLELFLNQHKTMEHMRLEKLRGIIEWMGILSRFWREEQQ